MEDQKHQMVAGQAPHLRHQALQLVDPLLRTSRVNQPVATRGTTTRAAGRRCADGGVTPRIARRGVEHGRRLGRHRWVIERSLAWLVGYRRLQVRYERRADVLLGFVYLACALICLKWTFGSQMIN
jgi:transposase